MAAIDTVETAIETGSLEAFAADTDRLRPEGDDHDITLVVDGKKFPAHKLVLAAESKYFQTMFTSTTDSKEKSQAEPRLILTPECVKADVFGVVLEFIYLGELHLSEHNCFDVLIFGCYLQVNNLAQTCSSYIDKAYREKRLQFENPLRIFNIATKHNIPELRDTALAHVACDFIEVSNTEYFLAEMTHDLLIQLFERTDLAVTSEEQVLDAVIRWLKHDWDARKTYAWPVLQKVRLGLIPIHELRDKFTNELKEDKNCMAAYCELLEFNAINGIEIGPLLQTFDDLFTPRNTNKGEDSNVFIKNFDKYIDDNALYDVFSAFGNILSCKVACDEKGSKGYGFVNFETDEAAQEAILKSNGMLLNGKKVYVGKFIPHTERLEQLEDQQQKFTNVFIKNFGKKLSDDELLTMAEKYGKVMSCKVMTDDETGKCKGFGFVSFESHEAAEKCIDELNNSEISGSLVFAGRAQKKADRLAVLKARFEKIKQERSSRCNQRVNLYIKNLDQEIDDDKLREEFSRFGTITSAKVMANNQGKSKGFGFVCFSSPEEATKAVTEMNGSYLVNKPLYVALAQPKEERKRQLANQITPRITSGVCGAPNEDVQPAQQVNQIFPGFTGYYAPTMPQARWQQPGQRPATNPAFQTMAASHSQFPNPHIFPGFTGYYTPTMPQAQQGFYAGQMQGRIPRWPQPGIIPDISQVQQPGLQRAIGAMPTAAAATAIAAANFAATARYTHNMPRQAASGVLLDPSTATQQAIHISDQKPLTAQMLAAASQNERRQMLGQRLFPIIYQMHGDLSGKITGMLLETDNAELLQMLESRDFLIAKVEEAVEVFKAYQTKESTGKVKQLDPKESQAET